jgi:hypothetical protein
MTTPLTVTCKVKFTRAGPGGRKEMAARPADEKPQPAGRVPRVARLMALAIRLDGLIRTGQIRDQAQVARLGRVTRARVTQIMNLLFLAPDLQEQLLFLAPFAAGRAPLLLRDLQPVAGEPDWRRQREKWAKVAPQERAPPDIM